MARSAAGTSRSILLVEADPTLRSAIVSAFTASGLDLDLTAVGGGAEGLAALDAGEPDVMLMPPRPHDVAGPDLLRAALERRPHLRVIVLGDDESETTAVSFMRDGAADYLPLRGCALARLPHLCLRLADESAARRVPAPAAPIGALSHDSRNGADRFLASLSHDLRTPLAGLVALLDLLSGGADGPLTEAQRARLARVRASVDRLVSIAGQIGDLALVESGKLGLACGSVDLGGIALLATQDMESAARSRAVDIQLKLPGGLPPVRGDASRIRQILSILIRNALRHADWTMLELGASARGSMVEMTLRGVPRGLPVEALRSGIGDPADEEPASHRAPGTALDLTVAAGLVTLHGGRLEVEESTRAGWRASFTLHAAGPDDRTRVDASEELRPLS